MRDYIHKLLNWYFKKNALPYWIILLMDCAIVFVSGLFVYGLFNSASLTLSHLDKVCNTLAIYLCFAVIAFRVFHTYSGIVRYSSFRDLEKVGYATATAFLLAFATHYVLLRFPDHFANLNTRMLVAMFAIATLLMWFVRMLVKNLFDAALSGSKARRALIYGVKTGGIGLAKNIRNQKPSAFVLRGFLSDDDSYRHNLLMGERVYSIHDPRLPDIIRREKISALIISPLKNNDFRRNSALQDLFIDQGVKVFMTEGIKEWHEDMDPTSLSLKEVSVEDLLPRDEIQVDMQSIGQQICGRTVLVTGSAGSIGSEMVRQIARLQPARMVLVDQAETPQHDIRLMLRAQWPQLQAETIVTSICNQSRMEDIFSRYRPNYVFHAAAYKHVPMMEDNPAESIHNNVYGTKVVADLSVKYGVKKMVMISTDKAVNPTNVMGCSKRICEIYCQSLNRAVADGLCHTADGQPATTQFVTTRFGNVLGSNGSVIPLFKEQIRHGGPVTVTDRNITRFFMLIPEACKLVLEAGAKGNGGEIYVFDMGEPVKIADLAKRMIMLSGAKNVKIEFTGLRQGEKLYEEVLNKEETTKPSFHDKIRIANVREYDYQKVSRAVDRLIADSTRYDDMLTVSQMKELVPEYKSNNSVYEALDKH